MMRGYSLEQDLRFLIRSEEHTSELQSQSNLVCRLLLEKKKKQLQAPGAIKLSFTAQRFLTDRALLSRLPARRVCAPGRLPSSSQPYSWQIQNTSLVGR